MREKERRKIREQQQRQQQKLVLLFALNNVCCHDADNEIEKLNWVIPLFLVSKIKVRSSFS